YLLARGRIEEGINETRRAVELDPLTVFSRSQLARAFYLGKRYDDAIAVCREVIQMDANHASAYLYLGQAYDLKGDFNEALTPLTKARSISPSPERVAALGHLYARTGRRDDALRVLAELKAAENVFSPYYIANIHTALGEREEAFNWLNRAYEARDPALLVRVKIDPKLDPLR